MRVAREACEQCNRWKPATPESDYKKRYCEPTLKAGSHKKYCVWVKVVCEVEEPGSIYQIPEVIGE